MSTTCPICGMTYVKELSGDRSQHRSFHAEVMKALQPKPNSRFLKLLSNGNDAVHVNSISPKWLQWELFLRARRFQREFDFDFPQWSPFGDEQPSAHGFLFNDTTGTFGQGAIVGGCVFRWVEFLDAPDRWGMDWVWIAPDARRKGVLSRNWPNFIKQFGEFHLTRPVSEGMMTFAAKHSHPK
jgi:hypothetical protein